MIKRALLSVYDKAGLIELGQALVRAGVEIISTGGTARTLEASGVGVRTVESLTGFPEILGGRVKTLHPAVHAAILARREPDHLAELEHLSLAPIDLVVVNLYPFEKTVGRPNVTLEEAIEQIDIGGVTLLRAAAKNFVSVVVLSSPDDYGQIINALQTGRELTFEERRALAVKAFSVTAAYDAAIRDYLSGKEKEQPGAGESEAFPPSIDLKLEKVAELRYGENPHQRAAFYRFPGAGGLPDARLLHGKALSYNNLLDIDAAWRAVMSFAGPTAAIIKHNNPCGLASGDRLVDAYRTAFECDPLSAFGGVIACNVPVDVDTALAISETFIEAVIAPSFDPQALDVLSRKRDIRLLEMPEAKGKPAEWIASLDTRRVTGGLLLQDPDHFEEAESWKVVTSRRPSASEMMSLAFAWRVVAHVKSNAIVLVKGKATVGIGAGQMSRVDATELAIKKAGPQRASGSVLASDAFFPFPDSVELAAAAGVTAIIQPGGSIRDEEVIAAANKHGLAMVFTGSRHFRH